MAEDKSGTGKGAAQGGTVKRPYATLNLKATEIKVMPLAGKSQAATAATADASRSAASVEVEAPRPAPARSYATAATGNGEPQRDTKMQTPPNKPEKATIGSSAAGSAARSAQNAGPKEPEANVVAKRRGGFVSHLAAGIVGGIAALAAAQWVLPELDISRLAGDNTSAISQRLTALEKSESRDKPAPDLSSIEIRVANLEQTAQTISALSDGQRRLVAETKAALASAASDAGSPQLIERLGKVEDKLKALADAGANDPHSGRIEQLAALTGKVSDLETSLATQLGALRASVAKDVEGRIQAATEASEAARAGTQRIDKDVAGLKSDAARMEERIDAAMTSNDRIAADLKATQDEAAQMKTAVEGLQTTAAKPADIAAAIAAVSDRIAALEKNVEQVVQGDAARKESAEQVVLAIELQNLKRALDSGHNFATELAAVQKVAGNRVDLTALTTLQDSGVPSLAELTREFRSAADKAIDADAAPESAGVVDRLWAEAKSVIRVRRIDLKPDDKSTEAAIGRMQVALSDGRLADVLEAAKELSPAALGAAQPFLDKVAARVSVDRALAGLQSELKSSIAAGSQPPPKQLP
jgi:hypothetical protein